MSVLLGKTSASALSRWGYGCWEIEHEKKENRIFSAGPASSVGTMRPNIVSIELLNKQDRNLVTSKKPGTVLLMQNVDLGHKKVIMQKYVFQFRCI